MAHSPSVLALVTKPIGRIQIHIVNPLAPLVHRHELRSVVLAGYVRSKRSPDVHSDVSGNDRLDSYLVVFVQYEEVEVVLDALHRVVVVNRRLASIGLVVAYCFINVRLRDSRCDCLLQPVEPLQQPGSFSLFFLAFRYVRHKVYYGFLDSVFKLSVSHAVFVERLLYRGFQSVVFIRMLAENCTCDGAHGIGKRVYGVGVFGYHFRQVRNV